jgi:hypothetical protein
MAHEASRRMSLKRKLEEADKMREDPFADLVGAWRRRRQNEKKYVWKEFQTWAKRVRRTGLLPEGLPKWA